MRNILKEKLQAYILINNPDLAVQLQSSYTISQYLTDKVDAVMPVVEQLVAEGKPSYIIEELCLNELTAELSPSKFNYIKAVIEEEFSTEYERLRGAGVLTYECINLVEACQTHFEAFQFSDETEDNRFLRYMVIATVHEHFN